MLTLSIRRLWTRRTILVLVIVLVIALVGIAVVIGARSNWGASPIRSGSSADSVGERGDTALPPTPGDAAANERFAQVGRAPITASDRAVVDLGGVRDTTSPTLEIPAVRCEGTEMSIVVGATDNDDVTEVRGTYSSEKGIVRTVPFTPLGDVWRASVTVVPGDGQALTMSARDNAGNTRTRTITKLCN